MIIDFMINDYMIVVAALKQADAGIALLSSSPIGSNFLKKASSGKQEQNKEASHSSGSARSAAGGGPRRRPPRGGAAARERDGDMASGDPSSVAGASGSAGSGAQRQPELHGFRGMLQRAHERQVAHTKKMLADAELEQQMQLVRLGMC